jgi:hypothetical protein
LKSLKPGEILLRCARLRENEAGTDSGVRQLGSAAYADNFLHFDCSRTV